MDISGKDVGTTSNLVYCTKLRCASLLFSINRYNRIDRYIEIDREGDSNKTQSDTDRERETNRDIKRMRELYAAGGAESIGKRCCARSSLMISRCQTQTFGCGQFREATPVQQQGGWWSLQRRQRICRRQSGQKMTQNVTAD